MASDAVPPPPQTHPYETPLLSKLPYPPVSTPGCNIALGWSRAVLFRSHSHRRFQVVITGPGSCCLARWRLPSGRWRSQTLSGEYVCLIPKLFPFGADWHQGAPLLAMEIEDDLVDSLTHHRLNQVSLAPLRSYSREDTLLAELCTRCWRECQAGSVRHPVAIAGMGQTILTHLLQAHFAPTRTGPELQWQMPRPLLAEVLSYIHGDLTRDLSLEALAAVGGGFTPSYFGQLFKAATGLSPKVYVTGVRVRAARELLRTGNYTGAEVAQLVGFSSQQRLCECFQRHTGTQPSDHLPGSEKNPGGIENRRKPVRWQFR